MKIFPFGSETSLFQSFNLFLIAEGYRDTERADFAEDCVDFVEFLLSTPPFNISRARPDWLTIHRIFSPSAETGPAAGTSQPGRTVLESAISAGGHIVINQVKLAELLATTQIHSSVGLLTLAKLMPKSGINFGVSGGLLAILTPAVGTPPQGVDAEILPPTPNEYYAVATTKNGIWQQAILRGMAAVLGLGDEFELSGPDRHMPEREARMALVHPNIAVLEEAPVSNAEVSAWHALMSPTRQPTSPVVHPSATTSTTPDRTFPPVPATPETIEFWEGAGGYRRQIYRSAQDCLMRRRLGDPTLPVRESKVPFCMVCRSYLESVIG